MSIVNSVATYSGQGYETYTNTGATVNAAGLTVRVPSGSTSMSPPLFRGCWRFKLYNPGGTTPALVSLTLTATDGTNTVTVANFVPVSAITITSTAYVDVKGDYIIDTAASSTGGL